MARSISPAPGSVKPPIQRGTIVIAAASVSQSATISSVDTTRAELRMLGWQSNSGSVPVGQDFPSLVLTNATTVTVNRTSGGAQTVTVSWELTEYN